jgi:transposase
MPISPSVPCVRSLPAAGLFPPEDPLRETTLEVIHQPPKQTKQSRWTLSLLQQLCSPLASLTTLSGVWRRLKKWRIRWKRGRLHVTSPDPHYQTKMQAIAQALTLAKEQAETVSVLYSDETTCYRQPFVGNTWHQQGADGTCQPTAPVAQGYNSVRRLVGTLDVNTGRVLYRANSKVGVSQLVAFLKQIRKAYGSARRIILIWDNWPMHFYDNVLAEARAQRIELLNLPTYAPWTNPIEKLWRKLKQEVLCLHRHSQDWIKVKEQVHTFLREYDRQAPDLLRYVGLAKATQN